MTASIDLTNKINILLRVCECNHCNMVKQDQYKIVTCKHVVCNECLMINNNSKKNNCPICNTTYKATDISKDMLKEDIVKILNAMLKHLTCIEGPHILNFSVKLYIETARNHLGETPLHRMCKKGDVEQVLSLIQSNINVDCKDNAGWTALHDAVTSNQMDCVNALLMAGAYVNATGFLYKTPLHIAAEQKNKAMIELLLLYGADPSAINFDGLTPIDMLPVSSTNWVKSKYVQLAMPNVYIPCKMAVLITEGYEFPNNDLITFISCENFLHDDAGTHLVVPDSHKINLIYLVALIRGCFIVTEKFLKETILSNWIYQTLSYIPNNKKKIILKAIENKLFQRPRLFDNMSFYVIDYKEPHLIDDLQFLRNDLILLIDKGGGNVLRREPALRIAEGVNKYPYHLRNCQTLKQCSFYIIYMEKYEPDLCYKMKELRHKSSRWLLNCILNYNITDD